MDKEVRVQELDELEKEYGQVVDQVKIFEELKENLRQTIILKFEQYFGHIGYSYKTDTGTLQRVIQNNLDYSVDELKKSLSSIQWNLIKKEAIDTKKLNAMIETGQIKLDGNLIKQVEVDKISHKSVR